MSMSSETTGVNESNPPNIADSSINVEVRRNLLFMCVCVLLIISEPLQIKKLDTVLNSQKTYKEETNDSHLSRLQNLRNELNYISDTDWMYESLENKPQQ